MHLPTLYNECSQFFHESGHYPLLKNLPKSYEGFKKVKVRKRNQNDIFIEAFNKGFSDHKNLFQRSIFANGRRSFVPTDPQGDYEPFYIFPIDGYKFLYNPQIHNSSYQYKRNIDDLLNTVSKETAIDMFAKVITQSYYDHDLEYGIRNGAEIIIYGCPYYYALRASLVDDYNFIR